MELIFEILWKVSLVLWLLGSVWLGKIVFDLWNGPKESTEQPDDWSSWKAGLRPGQHVSEDEREYDEPGDASEYLEHYEDDDGHKFDPDGYSL